MLRGCCLGGVVARREVGFAPCPTCQRTDEPMLTKYLILHRCSINTATAVISAIRVRRGLGLENLALLLFLLCGFNKLLVSGLRADFTDANTEL